MWKQLFELTIRVKICVHTMPKMWIITEFLKSRVNNKDECVWVRTKVFDYLRICIYNSFRVY